MANIDTIRHLKKILAVLNRKTPRFPLAKVGWEGPDMVITLQFAAQPIDLLLRTAGAQKCWKKTNSFNLSISGEWPSGLPRGVETQLNLFHTLLSRSDNGQLAMPTPPQSKGSVFNGRWEKDLQARQAQAEIARKELKKELHWLSFVAYKSLITEDLYPHVSPLGDVVSTQVILDDWSQSVERIRNGTAPQKLGLYVHIPFCTVACTFCYCAKTDNFNRDKFSRYMHFLDREAEMFAPILQGMTFTSVYFGGGTPSLVPAPKMRSMFEKLWASYKVPAGTQIVYEGNPESLNDKKIEVLAKLGRVSRLTIGVQSLDETVQHHVKRFNKPYQVKNAVESARKWGIEHVNVDLMAGLPGQSMDSFMKDLEFLVSLQPDTVHLNGYRPLPRVSLNTQGDTMTPERVALRDEMESRAAEYLEKHGHSSFDGQRRRRTENAANVQLYDMRRQNSSLLGMGFPARAHAFGSSYYTPNVAGGFDGSLDKQLQGDRKWLRIPADQQEEMHKYLVTNLKTGFTFAEFTATFGGEALQVAGESLRQLEQLNFLDIGENGITPRPSTNLESLIARGLLYSENFMHRIKERWGPEYREEENYKEKIRVLVED